MNNKIIFPLVTIIGMLVLCVVVGDVLIKKITQRVIHELKRDYAPGPYAPGYDPDKVSPKFFQNNKPLPYPYENTTVSKASKPKWDEELWEKSRN